MSVLDLIQHNSSQLEMFSEPMRVIGIDLGTTNSTVTEVTFDPAQGTASDIRCIAVEQQTTGRSWWSPLVPSIVALHNGKEFIGEGARRLRTQGQSLGLTEKMNLFTAVKNDMGLKRTYNMAPLGYQSAAQVSGSILSFLFQAVLKDKLQQPDQVVVTVPASFQAAQRDDTMSAAEDADLLQYSAELLDEPVAAFIGYLALHQDEELVGPGETQHLMVFDFGGGTCDVAVFRVARDYDGRLSTAILAVSRYHRLGGGDIDQAILYEHLLPMFLKQNDKDRNSFDYTIKKGSIEPAFIGVAEELKIALCEKYQQLIDTNEADEYLQHTCMGEYPCKLPEGTLHLTNPSLSLEQFEELLSSFLDADLLFVKENEYRQSLSVFAPICDALAKCNLKESDIDLCLLAGGSSLIPQVEQALDSYFSVARMLTFDSADDAQTAIARGAALNALSLALTDQPVIQPVCQETIALLTSQGPVELIPKGEELGTDGYCKTILLSMPEDSDDEPISVRVEVVAQEESGQRVLLAEHWDVDAPVRAGETVHLECSYDRNQLLNLYLIRKGETSGEVHFRKEHPLTHIINPQKTKLRIEETEELLRTHLLQPDARKRTIMGLAEDCAELRQYEKAIGKLSELMRERNEQNAGMLNKMAIYYGYMNDTEREEKLYSQASAADPAWSGPWFNLALLMRNQRRYQEALHAIDMAIRLDEESGSAYILKAQILEKLGDEEESHAAIESGWENFGPLYVLEDWELYWYQRAAEMSKDMEAIAKAKEERRSRQVAENCQTDDHYGVLPDLLVS
jgi:molecular chaperone DnaK